MKNVFISFLLTISSLYAFSQGETDNWYFGVFAGLNFSSGAPVPVTGQTYTTEGSASISDSAGNLLFYTDGLTVWNSQQTPMPNGTGLFGGISSTQSALIVPLPGSDSIYYIFTTDEAGYSNGLCYSVVDLSLEFGLGDVIQKNIPLLTPCTEKLTGVTLKDGSQSWIVTHEWGTNAFRAYSLTASGLNVTPVISNVGSVHNTSAIQNTYGQLKFASCGERLAAAIGYQDTVEVFDFNVITGTVYNPVTLPVNNHVYGLEFSGNSSKLYVTSYDTYTSYILQYDLTAGTASDIQASQTIVGIGTDFYGMQIAIDSRIYVARAWNSYLGVINSPDYSGTACDFVANGVNVDPAYSGTTSALGLPNFVQSYFDQEHKFCPLPTAVEEPVNETGFAVYPNPTEGTVYFTMNDVTTEPIRCSVYDMAGRELLVQFTTAAGTHQIELNRLDEGAYLLKATTGHETFVQKVFVVRE
jgi:hypothetical protein